MSIRTWNGAKVKLKDRIVEVEKQIHIDQYEYVLKLKTGEILHTDFKQEAKLLNG